MIDIKPCSTDADFSYAVKITKDYIRWLEMDLSFQDIDTELSTFSAMYGPPNGLFLLARHGADLCGGAGLRRLEVDICEMKRLFVYDRFKGQGIGGRLCSALIRAAMRSGYRKMRLDTLGRMTAAIKLYEGLGFKEIDAYRFNPDPTAKFMELRLR